SSDSSICAADRIARGSPDASHLSTKIQRRPSAFRLRGRRFGISAYVLAGTKDLQKEKRSLRDFSDGPGENWIVHAAHGFDSAWRLHGEIHSAQRKRYFRNSDDPETTRLNSPVVLRKK